VFPELAFMIDVEDGGEKWNITGDQSDGVNDFIDRVSDHFGTPAAAMGYLNFYSNQELWQTIPHGLKLVVPAYNGPAGRPWVPEGYTAFGHQYADNEVTPPFGPCDINQAHITLADFVSAFGTSTLVQDPVQDPVPDLGTTPVLPTGAGDLTLTGRPLDPRVPDDLAGHVLSMRMEGLRTQALVAALCEANNIDVSDVFDKVKDAVTP
jgi:hypothetical protein